MNQDLQNAIEAIRKIQTQADLNTLAEEWKRQMTWIGNQAKRGLKIVMKLSGNRGYVHRGTIRKMNRKTMEIVAHSNGWGSTVTKVPNSMVIGKVAA